MTPIEKMTEAKIKKALADLLERNPEFTVDFVAKLNAMQKDHVSIVQFVTNQPYSVRAFTPTGVVGLVKERGPLALSDILDVLQVQRIDIKKALAAHSNDLEANIQAEVQKRLAAAIPVVVANDVPATVAAEPAPAPVEQPVSEPEPTAPEAEEDEPPH